MILPPGQCVKSAIDSASLDFPALLAELTRKVFTGYLAITIKGNGGIEEGTIIFEGGKMVACTYYYTRYDKLMLGSEAFPRVINASAALKGIVDIYQLTTEQVKLTIAFNEKMVFVPSPADMANINPSSFSPFFEDQIKDEKPAGKDQLLKRLKLSSVTASQGPSTAQLDPAESGADNSDMFEKIAKKI